MARFIQICILILTSMVFAGQARAQESLRILTGMEPEQQLDWRNPELSFDLNIPPGANAASLTLFANPGETLPAQGSLMVVSVNDQPGVVVNPRPESFSARIDLPASHLKAGRNHISVMFEGASAALCPAKSDGGWVFDLSRSRFDLSISRHIASFAALENWLAKGPWAIDQISIDGAGLTKTGFASMGAMVTQGLSIRTGRVPQIVALDSVEGLRFQARIDPAMVGPSLALRPGVRPSVEFLGGDEQDVLAAVRLFASRIIAVNSTRAAPALLAQAPLVQGQSALAGIEEALTASVWHARPFTNTVRAPYHGETRLVVELERADWVSAKSVALMSMNGRSDQRKKLNKKLNRLVFALDSKGTNVEHGFQIGREAEPAKDVTMACAGHAQDAPLKVVSAKIESSGYGQADGMARFAVDGAPFTVDRGADTAIVFGAKTEAQLWAGWRAAARIAMIGGAPLTTAWYGTDARFVPPEAKAVMVLSLRSQLSADLVDTLPSAFNQGAAAGPKEFGRRKGNAITRSYTAYADAALPPGLGVAAWRQNEQRSILILTGDADGDFAPSMHALADGQAMNFFAGRVLRWRAGLVEINAFDPVSAIANGGQGGSARLMAILFIIAGICLVGLWVLIWQRAYQNWSPKINALNGRTK